MLLMTYRHMLQLVLMHMVHLLALNGFKKGQGQQA